MPEYKYPNELIEEDKFYLPDTQIEFRCDTIERKGRFTTIEDARKRYAVEIHQTVRLRMVEPE